jgi:outer membrane protein OmpA-like peptidoglycan-associated protein
MLGLMLGAALPSVDAAAQLYGAGRNSAVTVDETVLDQLGYPPNVPGNLGGRAQAARPFGTTAVPREPVTLQLVAPPLRMPSSRLEQVPPARPAAAAKPLPPKGSKSGRSNQVMSVAATATPSQSPDPYAAVALQPKPSDPLAAAHAPVPAPEPVAAAAVPVDPSASVGEQLRATATPAAAPARAAPEQVAAVAPPPAPAAPAVSTPAPAVAVPAPAAEPAVPVAPAVPEKVDLSVLFDANSSQLSDAGRQALQKFASGALGGNGRIELRAFAGGNDEQATQARRLSLARALAVRSFLTQQGFATTRVDVRALGNQGGGGNADRVDLQIINS